MIRLSDIVKQKYETTLSREDGLSEKLRMSRFVKIGSPERTPSLSDQDMPRSEIEVHKVDDIYLAARTYMEGLRNAVKNNTRVELDAAIALIDKIVDSPELLFGINPSILKFGREKDYDIFQSVHTMIYALRIGLRLNYPYRKLIELGLATLLQNIGMFLIPDSILNKKGNLTDSEITMIKKHPEMCKDILVPYQEECPWLIEAIYQHHERENGKGYPRGLKENEIVEYAKIIGICDSYEAMTNNRPHKKGLMQFVTVRQLIESRDGLFSPQILKVFLEEMSLYPMGSYVKLNNGAIGRVIHTNRSLPLKPFIKLIFDGRSNKVDTDEFIDMATNSILNVVDVIAEEDLPL